MGNKGLLAKRLAQTQTKTDSQTIQSSSPTSEPLKTQPVSSFSQKQPEQADTQDVFSQTRKEDAFSFYQDSSVESEMRLEAERREQKQAEERREKRWKLSTRIVNIFLVTACIYVLFLIYGVIVTDYQYSEKGTIEPQTLSVAELAEQKKYETIYYQYLHCRSLYEKTLLLDYRLGKGAEDPMTLAPEYEALLDEVTNLSVKTDALETVTQYGQIKNLLLTWIKDDIAVYLQNISAAISKNDEERANKALQDKDRVYKDFSIITQNLAALGETIKGIDLTTIKEWTPESFVDKEINGK